QALDPQALEGVRRRARLVRAAPQEVRAALLRDARRRHDLLLALDGAGAGDRDEAAAADLDAADGDDRVLGVRLARDELVRLRDADRLLDAREDLELARVEGAGVPGDPDGRALLARDHVRLEPEEPDLLEDAVDLGLGAAGLHDDEHGGPYL